MGIECSLEWIAVCGRVFTVIREGASLDPYDPKYDPSSVLLSIAPHSDDGMKYVDPMLDKFDIHQAVAHRLFQGAVTTTRGTAPRYPSHPP